MSDTLKEVVEETTNEADVPSNQAGVENMAKAEVESKAEDGIESPAEQAILRSVETPSEAAGIGPTANERTWAALAHASILLTFALGLSTGGLAAVLAILVPLVIWLAFRDRSRFVAFHAMQATAFQVASLLAWIALLIAGLVILVPAWIVTILLAVILVGLLLLPLTLALTIIVPGALLALPFASLVYGLYAAIEVYAGRAFRYWRVAEWVERRGMKPA